MTASSSITRFGPLSIHGVSLPDHLIIHTTKGNLLTDFNTFGYDGEQFFGTAFIQGKRLQFTTAMPFSKMLKISKVDRAEAGSGLSEVIKHANRPRVPSHSKQLRNYFLKTACAGEKFILPAFAFNFGDKDSTPEDAPDAHLWIWASEGDNSTNGWPALFQLPDAIKLDTTDGAHREWESNLILNDGTISEDQKRNLSRNACDVKIIFEKERIDAHQDFADCAKAKPITASLISTFDIRDCRNDRTVKLVEQVPFLQHYVDATANNVNLSANSTKIWSMSAVRGFVGHIQERNPAPMGSTEHEVTSRLVDSMQGSQHFFASLIKHMPQFAVLDAVRRGQWQPSDQDEKPPTPAKFRNVRGGDIALRGVGMSLFARAFVYAKEQSLVFDDVCSRLGKVDWHLLDCERADLPDTDTEKGREEFADAVKQHLNQLWSSMLVIGESRYRIGSSSEEANQAWHRIMVKHFGPPIAVVGQAAE